MRNANPNRHDTSSIGVQGGLIEWWAQQDLNLQPTDYESAALTN